MAKSKKIIGYDVSKGGTVVSIPTSIAGDLVKQIGADIFKDKGITKIITNTYSDDAISGAPWGATDAALDYKDAHLVAKPTISGTYTYDGTTKTPTITGFDATTMTKSGDESATDAGTYTILVNPKAGVRWLDGTSTTVQLVWSIGKAAGTLSINPASISLSGGQLSADITVTSNCLGTINCGTLSGVSTSVSGNVITVTGDGSTTISGGTLNISVTPDSNHTAPTAVSATVNAKYIEYKRIGGRIFYDNGANGATYTFYDQNKNVISSTTIAGLANAYYYTVTGTPSADRWYVYDTTKGFVNGNYWGAYGTSLGITSDGIGKGKQNMEAMLSHGIPTDFTPNIWKYTKEMRDNKIGDCDDWYIGTPAEQDKLRASGLVDWYNTNNIASSVEYDANNCYAWDWYGGGSGALWTSRIKCFTSYIVAFRSF